MDGRVGTMPAKSERRDRDRFGDKIGLGTRSVWGQDRFKDLVRRFAGGYFDADLNGLLLGCPKQCVEEESIDGGLLEVFDVAE